MPEKKHWIDDDRARSRFWATTGDWGLMKNEEVYTALGVTKMHDFEGTIDDALTTIRSWIDGGSQSGPGLRIKTVSVTYERKFNLGNYESLTIGSTAWADLPEDATQTPEEMARELWDFCKEQVKENALPVLRELRGAPPSADGPTVEVPHPSGKGTERVPASDEGDTRLPPPPPPTTTAAVAAAPPHPASSATGDEIPTQFIKIVANKSGKPVIEFWQINRQYPEITYNPSAEIFFSKVAGADTLLAEGWTIKHFEAIGSEYKLPLIVTWEKSPNSPAGKVWKDIVAVKLAKAK